MGLPNGASAAAGVVAAAPPVIRTSAGRSAVPVGSSSIAQL